jgi:hypothetical protein
VPGGLKKAKKMSPAHFFKDKMMPARSPLEFQNLSNISNCQIAENHYFDVLTASTEKAKKNSCNGHMLLLLLLFFKSSAWYMGSWLLLRCCYCYCYCFFKSSAWYIAHGCCCCCCAVALLLLLLLLFFQIISFAVAVAVATVFFKLSAWHIAHGCCCCCCCCCTVAAVAVATATATATVFFQIVGMCEQGIPFGLKNPSKAS